MVGVAKRVRTIEGMPTMNVSVMPPIPAIRASHDGRIDDPGTGSNRNQLPMMVSTIPTPVQSLGIPTWTSTANASMASMISATAQGRVGRTARPVKASTVRDRADAAGEADAGGEELEDQQCQPGQQQQVGDRRAGHGVEQLVEQRELREAHHRHRVEAGRPVVEHDHLGGDDFDAVLLVAVHRLEHVADRGDALVVDALLEHAEQSCVRQPDRAVAESLLGDAEVDARPLGKARRVERDTDVADPGARGHAGDIGNGEELGGRSVEAGAARADPDADRNRGVGDADEQVFDHIVVDDRRRRC